MAAYSSIKVLNMQPIFFMLNIQKDLYAMYR